MCLENRTATREEEQPWGAGDTEIPKSIFLRSFYPEAHAYCVRVLSVGRKPKGRLYTGDLNPRACSHCYFAWVAARTQLRLKSLENNFSLSFPFNLFYWPRVDLQCSTNLCHTAKWSVTHIGALFFIFFSIVVYKRTLTIVPCAIP